MCLGIPGQVISIYTHSNNQLLMGKVSFGSLTKEVCLSGVPQVKVGDYVMVHVGFALNIINEKEAAESYETLQEGLA